jgi:acyl-CoA synthetase (NDP forming)
LILVHTKEIKDREKELLEDARKKYNGKIIIPND